MTRFFAALVVPAITAGVVAYFGYYAIWGERGELALEKVQTRLGMERQQLASIKAGRVRLQHRISLLDSGSADPDLVEEIARDKLMDGEPGQVAIPRNGN